MSSVLNIIKKNAKGRSVSGIPHRKLNAPLQRRLYPESLGIEIELEGTGLPTGGYLDGIVSPSGTSWVVKTDGSLRNGLEYVLSQPCRDNEVDYLVNSLFDVFTKRGTRLTPSNRCSLHVHYNIGGLKVNAITSMIALWTVFEEPLLRIWGDSRYKNHFCLSSKDETGNVEAWTDFLSTGRLPETNNLRYTALNIVAIRKYGSIEFRGGGAVTDPARAILWTRFLYRLCEYAKEKYINPQQLAYDISERGAQNILLDICGEEFEQIYVEALAPFEDFNRCCAESFYNFQPIIFGFPWNEWLPEITKEFVPNPFEKEGKVKIVTVPRFVLDPVPVPPPVGWRQMAPRGNEEEELNRLLRANGLGRNNAQAERD